MEGVSIVICCHNSQNRIGETLEFIVRQEVPSDLLWEVVVVDNASNDGTRKLAAHILTAHRHVTHTIISEPEPGLLNARRAGVAVSRFDVILFCDDDNHLDPKYLQTGYIILRDNLTVSVLGGWCKPKLDYYPGSWIDANYPALGIEPDPKPEGYTNWVFGAGMFVRKRLYAELESRGIKLHLTGRTGARQTSGDDGELCMLCRFLGYHVYYSPRLVLGHKISAHRLSKRNFIKSNYANVYMVVYFHVLGGLMDNCNLQTVQLYRGLLWTVIRRVFYYAPRTLVGKNRFFSFMMFFQNIQLLLWMLLRRAGFRRTYEVVRENLYGAKY